MSDIGGVWRTVGGRHIFIKDGKNLSTAMRESGKFKGYKNKDNNKETIDKASEGKRYREKLTSLKGKEDGTYDLDTGKKVEFGNSGYNVSFEQSTDNYTNSQYYDKIDECRNLCDGKVYGGVFGGDPEISFYTKDKKVATMIMEKYNQHSIWDNSEGDIIENKKYNAKKNKVNYKD